MLLKIDCNDELDSALGTIKWYMARYGEEWVMEDLEEPLKRVIKQLGNPDSFTIYGETNLIDFLTPDDQEFLNKIFWELMEAVRVNVVKHLGYVETFESSFELAFIVNGKILLKVKK